jgi:hypothetical protein
MESSPIKTVSVKLEIVCPKMKETSLSFRSFDSIWPSMVSLAKETTTTQPAFDFFYQNEDGNFCLRCCRRSLRLLCCRSGQRQSIVCVARPASVARVTHGAIVTWLLFLLFYTSSLSRVLLLFSTFSSRET